MAHVMNVEHETGLELARKLCAAEDQIDELYTALEMLLGDPRGAAKDLARAALARSKEGHDARVRGRIDALKRQIERTRLAEARREHRKLAAVQTLRGERDMSPRLVKR